MGSPESPGKRIEITREDSLLADGSTEQSQPRDHCADDCGRGNESSRERRLSSEQIASTCPTENIHRWLLNGEAGTAEGLSAAGAAEVTDRHPSDEMTLCRSKKFPLSRSATSIAARTVAAASSLVSRAGCSARGPQIFQPVDSPHTFYG